MTTTAKIEADFSREEILALHEEMEDGGKLDFLFPSIIEDDKDTALLEVTKDQLTDGGLTDREADLFLCAVAASARGDFRSTELVLYWASKD